MNTTIIKYRSYPDFNRGNNVQLTTSVRNEDLENEIRRLENAQQLSTQRERQLMDGIQDKPDWFIIGKKDSEKEKLEDMYRKAISSQHQVLIKTARFSN